MLIRPENYQFLFNKHRRKKGTRVKEIYGLHNKLNERIEKIRNVESQNESLRNTVSQLRINIEKLEKEMIVEKEKHIKEKEELKKECIYNYFEPRLYNDCTNIILSYL